MTERNGRYICMHTPLNKQQFFANLSLHSIVRLFPSYMIVIKQVCVTVLCVQGILPLSAIEVRVISQQEPCAPHMFEISG